MNEVDTNKFDRSRYRSLRERSYKQHLRHTIYGAYESQKIIGNVDFDYGFMPVSEEAERKLSSLYTKVEDVKAFNASMRSYVLKEVNKLKLKRFKKSYNDWFESNVLSYEKFLELWKGKDRKCSYCGISEKQISKLIESREIHTKRLYSRGETMEVDRVEPNGKYGDSNIVLSCYWCNNAKTDEFTASEFILIAEGIRKVWEARLGESL